MNYGNLGVSSDGDLDLLRSAEGTAGRHLRAVRQRVMGDPEVDPADR